MTPPIFVIIPCAGASAASYRRLTSVLSKEFETIVFELPGRGARWREPPVSSWSEAKTDLARWLPKQREVVIFGHSFGAYLSIGALLQNVDAAKTNCRQIIISSNCPPYHASRLMGAKSLLSQSDEVIAIAKRFGAHESDFPYDIVLKNRAIEILRLDFLLAYEAIESLSKIETGVRLDVRASVILGEADPIRLISTSEWSLYLRGIVDVHVIEGFGHFYPIEAPLITANKITSIINQNL